MTTTHKKDDSVDIRPRVGIFWLDGHRLIIDSVPVSEAEVWGEFCNYPHGHERYWSHLQHLGIVSPDIQYEQMPRGRIVYDSKKEQFTFRADRCILRNTRLISQIMAKLNLPPNTKTDTDPHYRCARCLERCQQITNEDV